MKHVPITYLDQAERLAESPFDNGFSCAFEKSAEWISVLVRFLLVFGQISQHPNVCLILLSHRVDSVFLQLGHDGLLIKL